MVRINCVIGPFLPIPPVMGGAIERIFLALCNEFARQGHQVTMISRQYRDFPPDEVVDGVHHLRVPSFDAPPQRLLYRIYDVIYGLRVCKILPPADITITHSVALPLFIPRSRAGRICVSVERYPKGQMSFYRRVDRLLAASTYVEKAIRQQSPSVAHLARTLPNCISVSFADAIDDRRGDRRKEILFVGRIAREKGIDILIRAFALLSQEDPDWRLVIVGPHEPRHGGDGADFLEELKRLGGAAADRIEFTGPIFDEKQLIARFMRSDIFVYPSVAEKGEAFGLAPVEAMACGCVTVVSKLACFTDFIDPDRNGIQFDHADKSGRTLAEALKQLVRSPVLRENLAQQAIATSRNFTPGSVARQFLVHFRDMLGAGA